MIARSHLYVPADDADRLAKALTRGADALIVDLEDGVAPDSKIAARAVLAAWLDEVVADAQIWVRINAGALRHEDVRAAVHPRVVGLVQAKSESVEDLKELNQLVGVLEVERNIAEGHTQISPLIESALGILRAVDIAQAPRVSRLQVGEADLSADIGVTLGADERELLYARSHVILACAAAGIEPPIAPVSTNFRDLDAFKDSTLAFKRMGYFGRACIHPAQIEVVNDVFTPSAQEIEEAEDLVHRFEAAKGGVCLDSRGRMVDLAVIRSAQRTLSLKTLRQ